jgi:RNA polymerase sigma factor (sigma-70 family)
MQEGEWLANRFEENRGHLRAVAYRMLGSASEAEDAVQEAWLRLSRSDADSIENLGAWLTTVVARVCLDTLRSRAARRVESLEEEASRTLPDKTGSDPEQETILADSVGLAVMVVLDRLAPAERLAFVLHDMFAMPFEEIASIVGRSPAAARQLASRARRRVQGPPPVPKTNLIEQRRVADAFLAALRAGDFDGLIAVLDPNVVVHADAAAGSGVPREIHGATNWAKGAVAFSRQLTGGIEPMLVDREVALVWARHGRLLRVLRLSVVGGKIATIDIIADPARLREFDFAVLPRP